MPKAVLELVDFKPNQPLEIEVRPDRLIIRLPKDSAPHQFDRAYKDFKATWQQLGEDTWVEMFGPDYEEPFAD